MRINFIFSAIGIVLRYISIMILIPCIVALIYRDYNSLIPFITASMISFVVGLVLRRNQESMDSLNNIKKSEALFTVSLSWIAISLISAIPYLFYGISPLDALFEATSGITTTGATILTHYDYPKAMFLWRALSQWLGGMGIIVLFVAILPQFRVAGRQMFYAEAPGPTEEKVTPRIRHTATALWGVYIFLTGLQIVLYKLAGMEIFDAVCNSLSTLAAGGFSPNAEGIIGYHSSSIIWITIIFMFLAGANFALQYKVIVQRKYSALIKSDEFRWYFAIALGLSFMIVLALVLNSDYPYAKAIQDALFQTVSFMTTTGFASVDYTKWDLPAKIVLLLATFTGACAGSASGGLKIVRVVYIFKYLKTEIIKILHPNAVLPIKIDKTIVSEEVGKQIISFVIFYFFIFAISAFAVSIIEQNIIVGFTGSISALGNIGPAFGSLGPYDSLAILHPITKIIFIVIMLVGRLELVPFLVMLHFDFWKVKN